MFAIKKRKLAGLLILFFLLGVLTGGGGFLLFENSQGGSVRIPVFRVLCPSVYWTGVPGYRKAEG